MKAFAADAGDADCFVEIPVRLPLTEIDRLAQIVDRARSSGLLPASPPRAGEDNPAKLALFARFILTLRRRRDMAFPLIEFGEPVWDMLLDLYVQHTEGRQVSVSSLCAASAVPTTTALRWLDAMVARGQFIRAPDPTDGRRVNVSLSSAIIETIEAYLTDMRQRAVMALQ